MNRALVIGGAGFIGTNLVRELTHAGQECIVVDDYSGLGAQRPRIPGADYHLANIAQMAHEHLEGIDVVYFLAARTAGLYYNSRNQTEMCSTNLQPLLGLPYCFSLQPRLLVYFSTACVYPADAPVPTPESYGDIGLPESTNRGYGLAKRAGERLVIDLGRSTGVPICILRVFNTYGPWDFFDTSHGHFIPTILFKMLRKDAHVQIWGGEQTRAFVSVDDVIRIIISLTKNINENLVVNIGHSIEVTIADVANMAAEILEYKGKITFESGQIGYKRRAADESYLRSVVNDLTWTPLRRGIATTVAWLQSTEGSTWLSFCNGMI